MSVKKEIKNKEKHKQRKEKMKTDKNIKGVKRKEAKVH